MNILPPPPSSLREAGDRNGAGVTTAVRVAEIRYGLERLADGRRKDRLQAAADEVFTMFSDYVLPFIAEAAERYTLIVSHCESIGRPVGGIDAQIAAISRIRL